MRNLRAIGCDDYQAMVFKPEGDPRSNAEYKTAERQLFQAEGRKIIANIGDQKSDLTGGFAEKTFKLPNVFYVSP
jgi:acid phosphatase